MKLKGKLIATLLACLMVLTIAMPASAATWGLQDQANFLTERGHQAFVFGFERGFATIDDASVTYGTLLATVISHNGHPYIPRSDAIALFGSSSVTNARTVWSGNLQYVRLRDVAESSSYTMFWRDGFIICIRDNTAGTNVGTPDIIEVGTRPNNAQGWRNWVDTRYRTITITGDDGQGNDYRNHSARFGTHIHGGDNLFGGEWRFVSRATDVTINRFQGLLMSNGTAYLYHYSERATNTLTIRVPANTFYRVMNSNDMGGPQGAIGCAVEAAFRISERNGFMTNVNVRIFGNGTHIGTVNFTN